MGVESLIGPGLGLLGNLAGSNAASKAASSAAAAQQAAIQQAEQQAQTGFSANQGTIATTGANASNYLNQGYQNVQNSLNPIVQSGNAARTAYANGAGVNGQAAQTAYDNQVMAQPQFQAAQNYAAQGVQQQFGNKLGSGAMARAMQDRQTQFAQQYINNSLQNQAPLMSAGNTASGTMAQAGQQLGTGQAGNTWQTGNANIGNQNFLTSTYMNGAIGMGNAQANNALTQGSIQQNMYGSIGNAFGKAFGNGSFNGLFGSGATASNGSGFGASLGAFS